MALAERLAMQPGHKRHTCQVHRRTEMLQRGRAGDFDGHGCILSLASGNPEQPDTDHTYHRDKKKANTLSIGHKLQTKTPHHFYLQLIQRATAARGRATLLLQSLEVVNRVPYLLFGHLSA